MANGGDQAVHRIAKGHGNPEEDAGEPPWKSEPAGDTKGGRRPQRDLPFFNEDDAPRAVSRDAEPREQLGGLGCLRRAEAEVALRVACGDEADRSFAERAGAVEENDAGHENILRRSRCCRSVSRRGRSKERYSSGHRRRSLRVKRHVAEQRDEEGGQHECAEGAGRRASSQPIANVGSTTATFSLREIRERQIPAWMATCYLSTPRKSIQMEQLRTCE
jgi:hypothetical protein